jgi:integrin alpha FG-GAP repeat containing protein 1
MMQGSLDILVQREASSGGRASRRMTFIKNNYYHDAFFLKALGA